LFSEWIIQSARRESGREVTASSSLSGRTHSLRQHVISKQARKQITDVLNEVVQRLGGEECIRYYGQLDQLLHTKSFLS